MKSFQIPEYILFLIIFLIFVFIYIRFRHYFWSKNNKGHDYYPTLPDNSGKCPRLNMWGFKMSVILILLSFNLILTLYLIYKLSAKKSY